MRRTATCSLSPNSVPQRHLGGREMAQLMRRHPLVTFFLLAYGLTWAIQIPVAAGVLEGSGWRAVTWVPAILGPSYSRIARSGPYRRTRRPERARVAPGALARGLAVVPGSDPRACCLLARGSWGLYVTWGLLVRSGTAGTP